MGDNKPSTRGTLPPPLEPIMAGSENMTGELFFQRARADRQRIAQKKRDLQQKFNKVVSNRRVESEGS